MGVPGEGLVAARTKSLVNNTKSSLSITFRKHFSGFCNIDHSDKPHSYVAYVNRMNADELSRYSKWQLFRRILRPRTRECILDIGCGAGHDSQILARLVGPYGHVVGIDRSKAMIRTAQKRIQGKRDALEFHVCDAHSLKFPDSTFDACLAIGTLMFMKDPFHVLTEVIRVLKPGGRLVAHESDWDTLTITAGNNAMTNCIVNILRKSTCHSGIGHQLPVLFWRTGFQDIGVESCTMKMGNYAFANKGLRIQATLNEAQKAGIITSAHVRRLLFQLKSASRKGDFLGTCTSFAVVGTKSRSC